MIELPHIVMEPRKEFYIWRGSSYSTEDGIREITALHDFDPDMDSVYTCTVWDINSFQWKSFDGFICVGIVPQFDKKGFVPYRKD